MLYVSDVVVEHRHFTFKKAQYDETYRMHREGMTQKQKRHEDKVTFGQTAKERQRDADKLQQRCINVT